MQNQERRLGILCHGQLALMMGEAANKLGVSAVALGQGKDSPASHAIPVIDGDFNDSETVLQFVAQQHITAVVLDTDHVNPTVFSKLQEKGVAVLPGGLNQEHTSTIQHRRRQKEKLAAHNVPLAPWFPAISEFELREGYKILGGGEVIIKAAEAGFDGRGNLPANSEASLLAAWEKLGKVEVVVERRLDFEKEIAVIAAEDNFGQRELYPRVQSVHHEGMLEYTLLPALITEALDTEATRLGNLVLDTFAGPGLLGIEFMVANDRLVVNEVAGRVHNTGHGTIESSKTSQFENIVRIAMDMELGSSELTRPGETVMMRNLNGGTLENVSQSDYQTAEQLDGTLHWYFKSPRARRKRGHVTLFDATREGVMAKAGHFIKEIKFNEKTT